ncbi:MAG: hypothetical protein U0931_06485 [Vulcanimicrobiota bacterium]
MRVGFRADKPESLEWLRQLLVPLDAREVNQEEVEFLYSYRGGGRRGRLRDYHLLYSGARQVVRTLEESEARRALHEEVNLLVGVASPNTFCLRGGAVLWRGRALVILGGAGRGTTRLMQALVSRGGTLLSDGLLLFDGVSGSLLAHGEHRPASILLTEYQPRARYRPLRLQGGEAALKMFAVAPAAAVQPAKLLGALVRLAATVGVFQTFRPEAARVADRVLNQLYL